MYWFSHCAWRARLPCASARITELSVSKKMRSPTLTVKSWAEPGVAAPAAEAEIGRGVRGLLVGAARDRERQDNATTSGLRGECCDAAHAGLSFAFE